MNNENRIILKEGPPSPSSDETTCASTVNSTQVGSHHHHHQHTATADDEEQRRRLANQIRYFGLASVSSATAVTVAIVPFPILLALSVVMALWFSLLFKLYQRAQLEYQSIITGRGIGRYLPQSLYDQLVNVSFHEWMVNGTFVQENQHFLLYFIPGVTNEHLEEYVNRLIPRHRRALMRPGLGNFLGPQFMRLLLGDQGLAEREGPRVVVPQRLELGSHHAEEVVEDDVASGFGDEDEDDPAAQFARFWGAEPVGSSDGDSPDSIIENTASPKPDEKVEKEKEKDDDDEDHDQIHENDEDDKEVEDLAVDEQVVWEAIRDGVDTYRNVAMGLVRTSVSNSVGLFTGTFLRTTLGLGAVTIGAGLFGLWTGYLDRNAIMQSFRLPRQMPRFGMPSSTILISSTLASGTTAGLFVMFGWNSNNGKGNNRKGSEVKP